MKIETVDLFYLSMPKVLDIGDGSQDALLVRVQGGGHTGWGECEASPLVSIANWCCPMSHSAARPVCDSVLGQELDSPADIVRINQLVHANGLDIAQTDHTLSGIDIALWDLLGKRSNQPIYELLGYPKAYPKTPYASQLFGDTPEATYDKARKVREQKYRAAKFGWGLFGLTTAEADRDHIAAAREGLGQDIKLMIDVGTVWVDDVDKAMSRLKALQDHDVLWLEEPFVSDALEAYGKLAALSDCVKLAGGEGAHNFHMAKQMIDHAGLGFIQIDTGRIGGITVAKEVADYARTQNITYINHTFTTSLALSASLQPFAGLEADSLCEYPTDPSCLALELADLKPFMTPEGQIKIPESAGLGVTLDPQAIEKYRVDVEIVVAGQALYRTPSV